MEKQNNVTSYNGFVIVVFEEEHTGDERYNIYEKEEFELYGEEAATIIWDVGSVDEGKEYIDCY